MTTRVSLPWLVTVATLVAAASGCPTEVATGGCKEGQSPAECRRQQQGPAEPPSLYVDPPFGVGFDCIVLGCDVEKTLVVSNRGGGSLRVSLIRLSVDSSIDFTLRRTDDEPLPTPEDAIKLAAGESIEIGVRYRPSDGAHDSGELVFETSDGSERYEDTAPRTDEIPVTTRSLGDPVAELGSPLLDFGYVPMGESSTLSVRVAHAGTQSVLEVGPITLDQTASADFHEPVAGDWGVHLLNPGDEVLIPVTYTPTTPDAAFGAIAILTNDPVYPLLRVDLQGTAIAEPRVRIVDPPNGTIEMGSVRSGESRTRPLTVMNLGGAPLDVSAVISAGAEVGLSVGAAPQPTIGALQQTTLEVTLAAAIGGEFAGTVDVLTNDPTTPSVSVAVEGNVTAPVLTVAPASLDFGDMVLGWTAPAQALTLDNTGIGELTITGIAFDVGSSPLVRLANVPDLPIKLSPDEDPVIISVYVEAQQLGRTDAVLLLTSDSVTDDIVRFDISGNVVTCEEGCPIAHGVPDCSTGSCQVGDCVEGYHDADLGPGNGCECQEDVVGNIVGDIPQACPGLHLGSHSDNDGDFFRSGTLHSLDDVDMYYYEANDDTQFLDDDYGARVTLEGAPPGMLICANFQQEGSGCGGLPTNCSTWRVDGHGQSGIFGGSDNSEDATVWVMWAPDAEPMCGTYTVRFATDDNM